MQRREKVNAITVAMYSAMPAVLDEAQSNSGTYVAVITGNEPAVEWQVSPRGRDDAVAL